MKECKREKIIYFILFVVILIAMIFLHRTDLENITHEQTKDQEIKMLEEKVNELEQEMEAYRDNYTALWTTINNYHNNEN